MKINQFYMFKRKIKTKNLTEYLFKPDKTIQYKTLAIYKISKKIKNIKNYFLKF